MKRPRGKDQRPRQERTSRTVEPRDPSSTVYGVLPVLELLRSGSRRIDKIIVVEGARESRLAEILELARQQGIVVDREPRERLGHLLRSDVNHQGIAALTAAAAYTDPDEILQRSASPELLLLLDGVEDPRNFGAILRTADCAGVQGVFIPERRAVGITETVAKSSAGASEYVPVAKVPNLNRFIEHLKVRNIWVVGTAGDAEMNYTDWHWTRPSALVLGNEGSGIHRLVAENCDVLVKIPMYGKIQSLNVSVAAGVILFEARRQREISNAAADR
jgi:23S rRNA (guanosine2251-2'-O)-methyltransferase